MWMFCEYFGIPKRVVLVMCNGCDALYRFVKSRLVTLLDLSFCRIPKCAFGAVAI